MKSDDGQCSAFPFLVLRSIWGRHYTLTGGIRTRSDNLLGFLLEATEGFFRRRYIAVQNSMKHSRIIIC